MVQMNIRVPEVMRSSVDKRARSLGIPQGEWVRRALAFALDQPIGSPVAQRPQRRPEASRPIRSGDLR
jgi:hypothetical protein